MADFTLVDTDILIDAGRGVSEAIACLQDIERNSSLATSVVTQMELFVGCRNKAATALAFNVPFISKNQRDYRFIAGLHLLAYP